MTDLTDERAHVLRTPGYYVGQWRPIGHRLWSTATGKCRTRGSALASIARRGPVHRNVKLRVLFVPTGETGSYYDPNVVMEVTQC